ncbi:hypothetical protein [Paenibacillus glucanolyticus]|uniref:hypothetical protein n=1 Tax=Paenibacillus glucanolyticus TaxID=59843 RepID=UPI00128D4B86|nr:hypothetical protein [Paenibacillus glucanolyticus]MPY19076.1 hypothetical protein [Paenibacillus glucanolyticus]
MILKTWEGLEWQKHIQLLLKRHYGPDSYQDIPDKHVGDYGLEGYSPRDCVAFQCYAAEEPLTTEELYKKQRSKISSDIKKFIENKDDLKGVFGDIKIRSWVLVVPRHESALLLKHAEKKASEVKIAKLPYVDDSFRINIATEENFAVEAATLRQNNLSMIDVNKTIDDEELEQWVTKQKGDLIVNLERKINKITHIRLSKRESLFRNEMIKRFIEGQNIITSLHDNYPDIYNSLLKCKGNREKFLALESLINQDVPATMLKDSLGRYTDELTGAVKGVTPQTIERLVYEGVADWLMRCPLDFPEESK